MRVWSRGLGKQALNLDFSKCDITWEGNDVVIRGTLRNTGTVWKAQVTFTKGDLPGLMHFVFSFAMVRHLLINIASFFTFVRDRFILRRMGLQPKKAKEESKRPATMEAQK